MENNGGCCVENFLFLNGLHLPSQGIGSNNSFLWTTSPPPPQTGKVLGFQTTQATKHWHKAWFP